MLWLTVVVAVLILRAGSSFPSVPTRSLQDPELIATLNSQLKKKKKKPAKKDAAPALNDGAPVAEPVAAK